jgi:enoyl-CoA hydratase/carnithine racemase
VGVVERREGYGVVVVPAGRCLYEPAAADFVRELTRFAEDLHRAAAPSVRGVLVRLDAACDDATPAWREALARTDLFDELVERLTRYRYCLSLIRNAPVPWLFFAGSDVLGSAFELASSCQRRYVLDPAARVGFPAIEVGAFPPGGAIESLDKRASGTREHWERRPVLAAPDALEAGLIHCCLKAERVDQAAMALFREALADPTSRETAPRKRKREGFAPSLDDSARKLAAEELEKMWHEVQTRSARSPSSWEYCWRLVRERGKLKDARGLGILIARLTARHMFAPTYGAFLAARATARTTRHAFPAGALPRVVTIDLNHLAPPTSLVLRLLASGVALAFVAGDGRQLAASLNVLYGRVERALGAVEAQRGWERAATWYVGTPERARGVVLRCSIDDRIAVAIDGREWRFLRLEGNANGAAPGLVEWEVDDASTSDPDAPLLARALGLVADGYLRTSASAGGVPLSVHLRSLFLEELLRVAGSAGHDLPQLVEWLKAEGWRFAGDEEAWDRFLKTRQEAYAYDAEIGGLGARPIDRASWEIGSFKHARALVKRQAVATATARLNATRIGQHMAVFLGLVVLLAERGRRGELGLLDDLAGAALGFPTAHGSPVAYLRRRGARRVEHYAKAHWPRSAVDDTFWKESRCFAPVSPAAASAPAVPLPV